MRLPSISLPSNHARAEYEHFTIAVRDLEVDFAAELFTERQAHAFDCLGEYVLRFLGERGIEPTPDGISEDAKHDFNGIAPRGAGCQRADVASLISPGWRCYSTVEQITEVTRPPAFVAVLDVFPLGPPNGSIPLKNFLLAFQPKS